MPNSSERDCFCKDPENCPTRGILDNKYMCSIFMNYLNGSRNYRDISPKIYLDASFDNFLALNEHLKKGLLKCRYFVEEKLWEKGVGLILYGGYGTGKSRLGFTVLKEAAVMGCTIGVLDILRDFENFEGADAAIERAFESDLIFIDDLGAKSYEWIGQKIRIVIDEVNRNQKSVIISTNLNPKELVNFLDDRTVSRLIEIVPREGLIYLGEEDFRVKKREEKVAYFEQIR
jgi:DNA replication protein DnaC